MNTNIPETALLIPSDFVIIGGSGDLSVRKIIPALFWRFLDKQINNKSRIIICVRSQINIDGLKSKLIPHCQEALENKPENKKHWNDFLNLLTIVNLDVVTGQGSQELSSILKNKIDITRPIIFYLAISSSLFGKACDLINKEQLN
jgi:glucose-6-phosphate 1-dehydrogenase